MAYRVGKKKQKYSVVDVLTSNVPAGAAKTTPGYETRQEFYAREKAEEQARNDAPRLAAERKFNALQEEVNTTTRELNSDIRNYWMRPLSEMNPREAVVDTLGGYELRSGAPLSADEQRIVAKDFFAGLAGNDIHLTPAAQQKFGMFFACLDHKQGIAYTLANLVEALDRLVTLGVFVEGRDLTGFSKLQPKPAPKPVPAPAPQPTFDDILDAHSTESREGRKVLVNAVGKAYEEIAIPMFHEWVNHLSRDYKGFTLSREDATYIMGDGFDVEGMFRRNNWSFNNGDNFNKARRAMVAQGKWPESMLTPAERIAKELESLRTSDPRYRETMQRLRNAEENERRARVTA